MFNKYLEGIDRDFWRNLCVGEGELRHYARGEEFAKIGEVAPFVGYVKSGTLKYVVYSGDGSEHVVGLEFADEFVADFPFSLVGKRARVSIVAASPCEIYCASTKLIGLRLESDEELRRRVAEGTAAVFDTVYDRYVDLYTKTLQERYEDLISRHPDLFALFPLKDIASFLKVTPTHLSRLRKLK